jgi:hypothetical protein
VSTSDPRATPGRLSPQDMEEPQPEGAAGCPGELTPIEKRRVCARPEVVGLGILTRQVRDRRPARQVLRIKRLLAVCLGPQCVRSAPRRRAEGLRARFTAELLATASSSASSCLLLSVSRRRTGRPGQKPGTAHDAHGNKAHPAKQLPTSSALSRPAWGRLCVARTSKLGMLVPPVEAYPVSGGRPRAHPEVGREGSTF